MIKDALTSLSARVYTEVSISCRAKANGAAALGQYKGASANGSRALGHTESLHEKDYKY